MKQEQLTRLANLTSEELRQAQARIVLRGLEICREKLEEGGVRHSWLDGYIGVAKGETEPAAPIDMVLHCPSCGLQHIDAPRLAGDAGAPPHPTEGMSHEEAQPLIDALADYEASWTNPPHRSHLCHHCGHIWRPADVPTNGVAQIKTRGKNDSK
jgi:hypothetical protein